MLLHDIVCIIVAILYVYFEYADESESVTVLSPLTPLLAFSSHQLRQSCHKYLIVCILDMEISTASIQ